jgi:transcriptional regulator with XRE-family HTH domain
MPFDPKDVARAVRQHRVAAGLTQAELAERAGLAFETISRVEGGREPPSLRTAMSLADALGASLDAVVGRTSAQLSRKEPRVPPDVRRLLASAQRLDAGMLRHLAALARGLALPIDDRQKRTKRRSS